MMCNCTHQKSDKYKDIIIRYLKHVWHSSGMYPLTTFWMITSLVIPATWSHLISHIHGVVLLGFAALGLIVAADKRDTKASAASFAIQLAAVQKLVQDRADTTDAMVTDRADIQDVQIAHISDNTDRDIQDDVPIAGAHYNPEKGY